MLEPSDNGITFEGLIDALMVSLYLALHSSSIEILILSLRMELIETQVLYEECNQVKSKSRSQQISAFISTFQVGNLRFAQTLQLL